MARIKAGLAFTASLIGAVIFGGPNAMAHRIGIPLTEITWNPRSAVWEVSHRVSAHDLEPLLAARGLNPNTVYETPEGQVAIGRYLIETFTIKGEAAPLSLSYIGTEADQDVIWVFFELQSPDQLVSIHSRILADIAAAPETYTLVNIQSGDQRETLIFTSEDGPKAARLQAGF